MWGKSGRVPGRLTTALAWLSVLLCSPEPASAGSFSVNPVQISLPDGERTASLLIENSDAVPVSIHAEALDWTQLDGIDRYGATANVIVSPPIFTVAPGKSQIVRIGLRTRPPGHAYRVILEEIPRQERVAGEVQVRLRLNLPVYLLPPHGGRPDVHWRAWKSPDGSVFIEGRNEGSLHQQVTGLEAEQDGASRPLSKQMGVILPGSSRLWKLASGAPIRAGVPFTLKVESPSGDTQTQISLELR
jgi:fimbrial chaperone protein